MPVPSFDGELEPGLAKQRLKQAFDLFEAGLSMKRAAIRREYPDADDDEVSARLREWLATRPGVQHGNGVGRPRRQQPPE